ncbi:hypothetical protein [Nannocystis bainbridge]|uniref:Uncharacterized protein n=1 Tax=Nannocystis bainbridge TaxID=2995303 RepID=A0ABT5EDQ4_9BACT|nr:hypothetical protein [Nannocystis bainbridge]MDC0723690.1 hypothetical protein [Nannocystis bainbridge]
MISQDTNLDPEAIAPRKVVAPVESIDHDGRHPHRTDDGRGSKLTTDATIAAAAAYTASPHLAQR